MRFELNGAGATRARGARRARCLAAWASFLLAVLGTAAAAQDMLPPAASGVSALFGTWSGDGNGPQGSFEEADTFATDGTFLSVGRSADGELFRTWGSYRATIDGRGDRLLVEVRPRGWLPREVCNGGGVGEPGCKPLEPPQPGAVWATFPAPGQLVLVDAADPGRLLAARRDNRPALLTAAVPERRIVSAVPGRPRPHCDEMQQRRRCIMFNGRLLPVNGCLTCVPDKAERAVGPLSRPGLPGRGS